MVNAFRKAWISDKYFRCQEGLNLLSVKLAWELWTARRVPSRLKRSKLWRLTHLSGIHSMWSVRETWWWRLVDIRFWERVVLQTPSSPDSLCYLRCRNQRKLVENLPPHRVKDRPIPSIDPECILHNLISFPPELSWLNVKIFTYSCDSESFPDTPRRLLAKQFMSERSQDERVLILRGSSHWNRIAQI